MAAKQLLQEESNCKDTGNGHSRKGAAGATLPRQADGARQCVSPEDIEHLVAVRTAELSEENERLRQELAKASPSSEERDYLVAVARDITERKQLDQEREKLLHDSGERVKELTCMYGIAQSIRERETLEEVFQDVAALIPPGWHYPEITRGKVRFEGKEFVSQPFEETEWKQTSDIVVNGEVCGSIEVYYLEPCSELDEGPFMKEERHLIDSMGLALGEAVEHKRDEEELARA